MKWRSILEYSAVPGLFLACHIHAQTLGFARDAVPALNLNGEWSLLAAPLKPADIYLPDSPGQKDRQWQPILIPNNWYSAGHDLAGAVWHRRYFDVDKQGLQQQATLYFQAVDYAADVWLNGQYLGFHEGYFSPFAFDVSRFLQAKNNLLVVRVDSPNEPVGKVWSLHKRLIKGVLNHHDTRPAGAWSTNGQDANSGGIWDDVGLSFSRQLAIDVIVPRIVMNDNDDDAQVTTDMRFHGQQLPVDMQVLVELEPIETPGKRQQWQQSLTPEQVQRLPDGSYQASVDVQASHVQRWWPKEYGPQNRYRLSLALVADGKTLDHASREIAFRTVRYDKGQNAFFINGKRLFLRGTNYIASPWLASMKPEDYRRDLQLMQQAHINAVRVHAHVAGRAFYDMADRMGMLVWQDFPLQWGYQDSEDMYAEAERQAHDMLVQLGTHPSVFAWSAHNEPPWNADWMKYKYEDYQPDQNRELTLRVDQALAADTSRYVHAYSAGEEHLWMGWYSGNWHDHAKPAKVSIVSEFGAQALPALDVLRQIIPAADLWPRTLDAKDPAWKSWDYHNFQVQETFKNAGIARGESLEEFIGNSQTYQARLTQLAAESYRRQRYQPVAAVFQFMFNETWPSINWGVLDYQRHAKPGYAALALAYQPILPSIEWDSDRIKNGANARFVLWALNDTWQRYPDSTLAYRLVRMDKTVRQGKRPVQLEADSGQPVWELNFKSLDAGDYQLEAVISRDKTVLGSNRFSFTVEN